MTGDGKLDFRRVQNATLHGKVLVTGCVRYTMTAESQTAYLEVEHLGPRRLLPRLTIRWPTRFASNIKQNPSLTRGHALCISGGRTLFHNTNSLTMITAQVPHIRKEMRLEVRPAEARPQKQDRRCKTTDVRLAEVRLAEVRP